MPPYPKKKKSLPEAIQPGQKLILQAELSMYVTLAEVGKRGNELRTSIQERLEAGAKIEPGLLSVKIETEGVLRLTWDSLATAVGQEQADDIKQHLSPTPTRRLKVQDATGKNLGWHAEENKTQRPLVHGHMPKMPQRR